MPQEGQGSRVSIASLTLNLDIKWGCVINAKLWPLYPKRNSSSIHRGGGWMGSRAGLDEYGEEKISSLAPPEFEPRTATSTKLRVLRTMSCVILPHSITFSNCKLWVLQIRNLERTWHTAGLPPFCGDVTPDGCHSV